MSVLKGEGSEGAMSEQMKGVEELEGIDSVARVGERVFPRLTSSAFSDCLLRIKMQGSSRTH
jgi:hypothetical protein